MRRVLRFLSSRVTVSALLVILEVLLLAYLFIELSAYSVYFLILVVAMNILILVAIINADYNPEYKLTWLAVVLVTPVLGGLLYVMFRRRRMSKREARLAEEIIGELNSYNGNDEDFSRLGEESPLAAGKAMAIVSSDPTAEVFSHTVSRYFALGEDMYRAMLEDLSRAEKYIFLEYFTLEEGVMLDGIVELIKKKAAEGVDVRLLYDDVGSMSRLPVDFDTRLRECGISVLHFSPITPRIAAEHNNRDHRKILSIDGKIGYTGGINVSDEYINERERFGHWKDGGIRLEGEAVIGLTKLFLTLWDVTRGKKSDYAELIAPLYDGERSLGDGGYYIPFGSGPAPVYEKQVGKRVFIDIINQAQSYVYITTPYLIIDYDLTEALTGAASRGVDVRIITPGIPDKKIVKVMTKSAYPYLIRSGVKIYEYTPGFIHEKLLISDDKYAVVGTINLDYRSLVHHFEDAVWLYKTDTVLDIREGYMKTLEVSERITKDNLRLNLPEIIMRCLIRIFAPLL